MALKVSLTFTDGSLTITKEAAVDTTAQEEYATQFQVAVKEASGKMLKAIQGAYGDARFDESSSAAQYCFELEAMHELQAS